MRRIDADVARELGRFGPQAGIGAVVDAWPAAVGEGIARNAWPARIARDGTLHVHTTSSAWAFELGQLEPTLRERLCDALPDGMSGRLRFAVGLVPEWSPAPSREAAAFALEVRSEHRAEADALVAGIANDELRGAVAGAAAASLARAAADRGF